MSTYLELCHRAARESGTVSGDASPTVVTGQSGRLKKIVDWVSTAWVDVQNLHSTWTWMRKEFSGTTSIGSGAYTAASWDLSDHAVWIAEDHSVTMYKTATGVSDEGELQFIEWDLYRRYYRRGTQDNRRPINYSISPANEFCLGYIPDAVYTVKGEYIKTPQVLAANADVPECPSRFHDIIWLRALQLLHEHDEAVQQIAGVNMRYQQVLDALERAQLPRIGAGCGPLA